MYLMTGIVLHIYAAFSMVNMSISNQICYYVSINVYDNLYIA